MQTYGTLGKHCAEIGLTLGRHWADVGQTLESSIFLIKLSVLLMQDKTFQFSHVRSVVEFSREDTKLERFLAKNQQ